jgi:hypothetical protein
MIHNPLLTIAAAAALSVLWGGPLAAQAPVPVPTPERRPPVLVPRTIPVAEPSVSPNDRPAAHRIEVSEWRFSTQEQLLEALTIKAEDGSGLIGIVPAASEAGLYVFAKTPEAHAIHYTAVMVAAPLGKETLRSRIEQLRDKTFVGVHRFDENSYVMVFRNARP